MTTLEEIRELVDSYVDWLRQGIEAESISDDLIEITTPFLDRHNDHLQIYAQRTNRHILLSDGGEILADLVSSGVDVKQRRRRETIESVARGFGVQAEHGVLQVEATGDQVGRRLHSLIQAMLSVNDMYVLARSRVASFFWEDVREFLTEMDIRYTTRIKLSGRSGYDHSIDFLVPRSRNAPDRVLQTLSNPNKSFVSNALFAINDVRQGRHESLDAYALLDDRHHEIPGDVLDAFTAYQVKAAMWSERDSILPDLAA